MAETTNQIIPFYAHPHVFVKINDNTFYDEAVGTPIEETMPFATLVVTGADQGIDNTLVRLNDLNTKKAIFGTGNIREYGQASLQADQLFNGQTDVWFMRVLPDNATYANNILVAKYRKGNVLDELGQETGLKRLEVKFEYGYAVKPYITNGARSEDDIEAVAESLVSDTEDPADGYMTLPLAYARSSGRGRYGNRFGLSIIRDEDAEAEYETKMYLFKLIQSVNGISRITNTFSGSLYPSASEGESTLIDDVISQFETGECPIQIKTFEDNFQKLYDFYKEIVAENAEYLAGSAASDEDMAVLATAQNIDEKTFDPIFGLAYGTRVDQAIPYYQNYTVKESGAYVAPDKEVATAAAMPRNISDWNTAAVGNTVVVVADETNNGLRWKYNVAAIDTATGNITYDEGEECFIDDKEYDGTNVSVSYGIAMMGGSDGDFESITVDGVTRKPMASEKKLLLAREQVKAFRGYKDRKILSPSKINIDYIFDANYNMTSDGAIELDESIQAMYSHSSVLTDSDYKQLSVLASSAVIDATDLNVKKAIYDLVAFRNRNGMPNAPDEGAGCSVYFDCGIVGLKNTTVSSEISDIIDMFSEFTGRAYSIDLGYYDILDPYTGRRETVTISYFIASQLINHIIAYDNKPFTGLKAQLIAKQRSQSILLPNNIIRDSFRPDIDLIDWDVKEKLFKSRINYWETVDQGMYVQRAVQNTRQLEASELLEENNVRVLNLFKKSMERSLRNYLFDWNDPVAREGYRRTQMGIYKPWIGSKVEDLDIKFVANRFEQTRMMMRCEASMKFRGIVKRITLNINVDRANYLEEGSE